MTQKNWLTDFARAWVAHWPAPARPNPGSLTFIQKKIQERENPDILILGSTSEFRDMLHDMDIQPTIVDFNEENYHILSAAMKHKDAYGDHETYIEADWRTMDLGKQFDIILADAVFNIVPKETNYELLKNIEKHLKPGGVCIDRIHLIPEGMQKFDFEGELKKRQKDIAEYSLYEVFATPMYFAAGGRDLEPIAIKRVAALGEIMHEKGLVTKDQIEEYRKLGKDKTEFVFFLPTKEFVDERVQEYFDIDEIFIDDSWPFYKEFYPNYVLRKKEISEEMSNSDEDKNYHAEPWKAFAARWKALYTSPGKPSVPDVQVYKSFVEQAITGVERPRVLVLGATPQIRDMLHKIGNVEVTISDVNMEMILAMTELLENPDAEEIVIRADWSDMPLESEYFDVVIGDLVIPNVKPENRDAFVRNIHRVLKPGAAFITRVFIPLDMAQAETADEVIARYAEIPAADSRSHEMFADLFRNIALDEEKMIYDISKLRAYFEQFKIAEGEYKHPNANITQYINKMWEMWKPMDKQWSAQTEKDYEEMLDPYFEVVDKKVAGICYYEHMNETFPLWNIRKK